MKKLQNRALACLLTLCMLLSVLPVGSFAQEQDNGKLPFADITAEAWYADAVCYVYENNLMDGVAPGRFAPDDLLDRAMLVTILYRADGRPEMTGAASFADVETGSWYADAVAWGKQNGIVEGVDSQHFEPFAPISREQLVTMLFRYAQYAQRDDSANGSLEQFADADRVSAWAERAMQWAAEAQIVTGKTADSIDPQGGATRAEAACMLMRFAENVTDIADRDGDGVPAYLEAFFGSSDESADTDGDGISDYIEIYQIGSDPTVADSSEDADDDGLTNLEELETYGTNPIKPDSDLDGLSDYDELFVYFTDPNNADTDGDGILDGDEIALGTDPKAATDLTLLRQELPTERIAEELTQDNEAAPTVSGVSAAALVNTVRLEEATDEAIVKQGAVIGKAVEVELDGAAELSVDFTLSAPAAAPVVLELTENGWNVLETAATGTGVRASVDHSGKFCVVDLAVLLDSMGVDTDRLYRAATGAADAKFTVSGGAKLLDDFRSVSKDELDKGLPVEETQTDVTAFVRAYLAARGVSDAEIDALGSVTIPTYTVKATSTQTDSDYDGISDAKDARPKSNVFSGKLLDGNTTSSVKYTFDYRVFFGNNKTYNKNLSTTSLLFSTFIYSGGGFDFGKSTTYDGGTVTSTKSITTMLAFHGMQHTVDYKLTASTYGDDDLSEVGLGHRTVTYNGQTKQIVAVIVRGTNGTIEEWSSNFDIGNTSKFSSYVDWTNKKNHKGFDVASNRILTYLKSYMSKYGLDTDNTVFWVTGHSRGAAIANLLSAKLIDEGRTVFAYTFAAPNSTTATNTGASRYQCIFNLVNEDDFVPCVPMTAWNFRRYGRTAVVDMTSSMENEWHDLTGKSWYNQMSRKNLNALVNKLAGVCSGWSACYKYTCSCHSNGTDKDITQSGLSASDISKVPARAMKYAKKSSYKSWGFTKYKLCQVPAYFMQILAEITAANGLGNQVSAVLNYKLADRYEGARTKLVSAAAIGGIAHPHLCETYYLLTQHATASNFQ